MSNMLFGDDEFESQRAPSPWDGFMSTPPSETGSLDVHKSSKSGVPKLAPEVEEGNVEYKLKLTDISPARFARLVTQLKWRLLEGGGQAYYELGVADSGTLIGLSRPDLERSLQTLDAMAGEIGASVIVVKEIEVPPAMVAFADKLSAYIDPETGSWTDKMSNKRFRHGARRGGGGGGDDTPAGTETETDTESELATPEYPPVTSVAAFVNRRVSSNPERPTAQSSPFIAALDDDLALFSMEPEPELTDDDDTNDGAVAVPEFVPDADVPEFALDIEISVVHKPRPFRRHVNQAPGAGVFQGKGKAKAPKTAKENKRAVLGLVPSKLDLLEPVQNKQEAKALHRRQARDRRREEKRQAIVAHAIEGAAAAKDDAVPHVKDANIDTKELATDLQNLHVSVESAEVVVDSSAFATAPVANETKEPRLIVEALVVRKMSIEEGFLDFGNFSLT